MLCCRGILEGPWEGREVDTEKKQNKQKELLLWGDCSACSYFDMGTISCLLRDKVMPQMAARTATDGLSCHHSALTAQLRNLWNVSLPRNPTPIQKPGSPPHTECPNPYGSATSCKSMHQIYFPKGPRDMSKVLRQKNHPPDSISRQ